MRKNNQKTSWYNFHGEVPNIEEGTPYSGSGFFFSPWIFSEPGGEVSKVTSIDLVFLGFKKHLQLEPTCGGKGTHTHTTVSHVFLGRPCVEENVGLSSGSCLKNSSEMKPNTPFHPVVGWWLDVVLTCRDS